MVGTLVRGVGVYHGVTFNFSSPKCVHLPSLRHLSLMTKIWIAATNYSIHFYIIVLFAIDSYSLINKFLSFIIFSLLINAVILQLNCRVLMPYLYIHFFLLDVIFST